MSKGKYTYGFYITKRMKANYLTEDETFEVYVKASDIDEAEEKARRLGEFNKSHYYTYGIKLFEIDERG